MVADATAGKRGRPGDRLLTRPFVLVMACAFGFFGAFGMTVPVLPLIVTDELGGGDFAVGVVVGSMAVSAILIRPWASRRADSWGRQRLVLAGMVAGALSLALSGVAPELVSLGLLRLLLGAGQALVLIGAVTMVMESVPAERGGEAISYFSVAPYLGIGLGSLVGQAIYERAGLAAAFAAAGVVCLLGVLPAMGLPNVSVPRAPGEAAPPGFHPAVLLPGAIFALGLVGPVAFTSFIALYVRDFGSDDPRWLFFTYSAAILAARATVGLGPEAFFYGARLYWHNWDLFYSLMKGVVFGLVIPLVATHMGLRTRGGAEGVGKATTSAVMFMTLAVLILDALFPPLFLN